MKKPAIPYTPKAKSLARQLRKEVTPAEKRFWQALRQMPFYQFVTFNRQKPIGGYVVDFFCHRYSLAIEIDGDSHYQDSGIDHDIQRTARLSDKGIEVLRFTNEEIFDNIEGVMEEVERVLVGRGMV